MGTSMSVVLSNIYMEDNEETSIGSAPKEMNPKIWKIYVDDLFEIIKYDQRAHLTDYLNSIDPPGSIRFKDELEVNKAIPFLDTLITRTLDEALGTPQGQTVSPGLSSSRIHQPLQRLP